MTTVVGSIAGEFRRYKALAEGALAQVDDAALAWTPGGGDNSIAILMRHLGGNLKSRFQDFLTTDGEKPWRDRDAEFAPAAASRAELLAQWNDGWSALLDALASMSDATLAETVTIRGEPFSVHEALHRALAHVSYHAGQIVYIAKMRRGTAWQVMSIPPGRSRAQNLDPRGQRPDDQIAEIRRRLT